jgi:hypothetical protein
MHCPLIKNIWQVYIHFISFIHFSDRFEMHKYSSINVIINRKENKKLTKRNRTNNSNENKQK